MMRTNTDRRVVSKTEVKVKESVLVEASGAFEPELVEILVSQQVDDLFHLSFTLPVTIFESYLLSYQCRETSK